MTLNGFKDATTDLEQIVHWWDRWPRANIGVATGILSGFDALDVDPRHRGEESLAELAKDSDLLESETIISHTGGGGIHFLFEHVAGNRNHVGLLPGVDVRADGGYIILPPSRHNSGGSYRWQVGKSPDEQSLAPWPHSVLSLLQSEEGLTEPAQAVEGRIIEGSRNDTLMSIAGSMRHRGLNCEEILPTLMAVNRNRCSPALKEGEVRRIAEGIERYPPGDAIEPSFNTQAPDLPPKEGREELAASFPGLVDIVEQHGKPAFLIKDQTGVSICRKFRRKDGAILVPPARDQLPWCLPGAKKVLELSELQSSLPTGQADSALYDDLLAYLKLASELPGEGYNDLLAAWILHTYLLDNFQYSPIICLFAVPERGKTRTGKALIYAAYRGLHVESLRDAYLVRVASNLHATIFFDVRDMWRKAEKAGSDDVILQRFERGVRVPRVMYPDRGPFNDTVYYDIFGPTIIGTNEGVHKILETRSISINMPESDRQFDNDITPENSLPLKERLLVFRASHMDSPLPDVSKPLKGRLGDILQPLLQVIRLVKPDREAAILRFVESLQAERLEDKADSLEAEIIDAISSLEKHVMDSVLPVKPITAALNSKRSDANRITSQRVGKRLAALGFTKKKIDGHRGIVWDQEQLARLRSSYGL